MWVCWNPKGHYESRFWRSEVFAVIRYIDLKFWVTREKVDFWCFWSHVTFHKNSRFSRTFVFLNRNCLNKLFSSPKVVGNVLMVSDTLVKLARSGLEALFMPFHNPVSGTFWRFSARIGKYTSRPIRITKKFHQNSSTWKVIALWKLTRFHYGTFRRVVVVKTKKKWKFEIFARYQFRC